MKSEKNCLFLVVLIYSSSLFSMEDVDLFSMEEVETYFVEGYCINVEKTFISHIITELETETETVQEQESQKTIDKSDDNIIAKAEIAPQTPVSSDSIYAKYIKRFFG